MYYSFKFKERFNIVERADIVRLAVDCLWTDEGKIGRQYLLDERKLSEKILHDFNLGYLPENVNHQLHGRIIMPLYDPSGNLIVITTRLPRKATDNDYLPVHWHERYEKSFYLYGINLAKEYMRKYGFVCLCEGQTDVMRMHQYGARNTIGLGCTNLHKVQLSTIYRYCEDIILILDNDPNQTGQKGVSKILKEHKQMATGLSSHVYDSDTKPIRSNGQFSLSDYFPRRKIAAVKLEKAKDPDQYITQFGFLSLKKSIKEKLKELREKHVYV